MPAPTISPLPELPELPSEDELLQFFFPLFNEVAAERNIVEPQLIAPPDRTEG